MSTKKDHLPYLNKGKFKIECNKIIFTAEEIDLIEKYGHQFTALTNGSLMPFNVEQEQFVQVARNLRKTTTDHENVWRKYLKRKEIEAKHGNKLYLSPKPEQDSFYSRDMVKNVKSMMFKVTKENHKK